ncbi:CDP-alcohol phosphatidyltransferase family protein [Micromonospora coxensis]|uniref:Phosphatidylglycerophosphate synthase n=1 Tax=Micromonospora coxensis TaxID=356852 RepID=A0A1C5HBF8_9ACTN|nr:CDP-alcohol phosphatidyltransferase family protein [Micromonospora coxensis]SCG43366.1 Phosphatidylglycerophosphate synthase [Micromonospora coxensis]
MSRVRTGPVLGLIAQLVLLAVLAATVGLGVAGWLAGAGYGLVLCAVLARGVRRHGGDRLGPADRVTSARAVLAGGVTALVVDALVADAPDASAPLAVLVPLTAVALALDAVDGWVARRTGTASALGARFDMEVDAFLILVLSLHVAPVVGPWVLAIGGMRYAFVAASWVLPWMRGTLPPRYWRKVVAAAQGVFLLTAVADVLPRPATAVLVAVSLALLVESFGHDVGWLWWHRPSRAATLPAGQPTAAGQPAAAGQSVAAPESVPAPQPVPAVPSGSAPQPVPAVPSGSAPQPVPAVPSGSAPQPVPAVPSGSAPQVVAGRPRREVVAPERPLVAHQPV